MELEDKNFLLLNEDCRLALKKLEDNSVDFIVTDPPYFIDGMGDNWSDKKLTKKASHAGVIGGLPVGMKFDTEQGKKLQSFMEPVATELMRVLKPGGFCVVFSQSRLYHRMAIAFENAGFEIRDMFAWKYEGQAKAFSQNHFIEKNSKYSKSQKIELIKELEGKKTPQLKPQMEPMVFAQKPREGTFVDNWIKWGTGLFNSKESLDEMFPGTVMEVSKQLRHRESKEKIDHMTVKPVLLISHLINLFTTKGQIVLDPFLGSGSHGVASLENERKFIGIEIEKKYCKIAEKRLIETKKKVV